MFKTVAFLVGILAVSHFCFAQTQIVTTGNNVVNSSNPYAGDIIIGSDENGGTRHDASIMWWSGSSADRISNTGDTFYLSSWNTTSANIALGAYVGGLSYFQSNVLIGKTTQKNSTYILDVAGTIRANSIVVNNTGADFVFEPSYKLISLPTLEEYITRNHHLPEIASAKEMQTNGVDLGQNQVKLLQKVEELTLYMIEKDQQLSDEKAAIVILKHQDDLKDESINQLSIQLKSQQAQLKSQQEQITLLIKQIAQPSK